MRSWLDPAWLAGVVMGIGVAVRSVVVLRRGSPEVAFWVWAVASFLPISQLFPFLYPMADRYLYFILPGLMGGDDLPGARRRGTRRRARDAAAVVAARRGGRRARAGRRVRRAFLRARGDLGVAGAGARRIPRSTIRTDARRGSSKRGAPRSAGDPDTAIAALRRAWQLGFNRYEQFQTDPAFAPLRGDPRFTSLVREIATSWVERMEAESDPTQIELRTLAMAQLALGDNDAAIGTLERALAKGGPIDARIRDEIAQIRALPR